MHFFPSKDEGRANVVSISRISRTTDELLEQNLLGRDRRDVQVSWGTPKLTNSKSSIEVYEFEDIHCQIILEYNSKGCVISVIRNELNK